MAPILVAYQSSWDLYLFRYHGSSGPESFLFDADASVFELPGSIAASHDEMRAVYWSYSYETKACSSSSAGASPSCASWSDCTSGFAGDVVAGPNSGFGAVEIPDGECTMRFDDGSGSWGEAVSCDSSSLDLTGPVAIAPVGEFGRFDYGLVAVVDDPADGTPYFVPSPAVFDNGFETGNFSAWSQVVQ